MKELEVLKEDWNRKSDNFKEYSENEIYRMLRRKSVSITKILFLIGLVEMILWVLYGYIYEQLPFVRIGLFTIFAILIAYLYLKMRTEESSITLMKSILNVRKVIFGYAGISLLLTIVDSLFHFDAYTRDSMAGMVDGYNSFKNDNFHGRTHPDNMNPELGNYFVFGIIFIITVYLLFLIYKKSYGRILFNLKKNYKELSKVDENAV